jgi:protein transport protein SEC24
MLPEEQSQLKSSAIPIFFNVEFQKDSLPVPLVTEPLIRCEKCKGYLNPFVEVVMPGFKWKCNLCSFINERQTPFQMKERKKCQNPKAPIENSNFNKTYFTREELCAETYELDAPRHKNDLDRKKIF